MNINICDSEFDPWLEVRSHQQSMAKEGKFGATAIFIGTMRDMNQGDAVREMTLEHYPGMTEKYLTDITEQAMNKWDLVDAMVTHRTGHIVPDDPIVVVAIWSEHRADAFDACRFIMEELKSKAPFWKKEVLAKGERWVEKNT